MTISTRSMLLGATLVLAGVAGKEALTAVVPAAHAQAAARDCKAIPVDTNTVHFKLRQLTQEGYEFKGGALIDGPGAGSGPISHLVGCK